MWVLKVVTDNWFDDLEDRVRNLSSSLLRRSIQLSELKYGRYCVITYRGRGIPDMSQTEEHGGGNNRVDQLSGTFAVVRWANDYMKAKIWQKTSGLGDVPVSLSMTSVPFTSCLRAQVHRKEGYLPS